MSIENQLARLTIDESDANSSYEYIKVFKNPNKLPITQIHLEKTWRQLRKDRPKDMDFLIASPAEIQKAYFETKEDIIPALDVRWLPKCALRNFEPYSFSISKEENQAFLSRNMQFIDSLDFLLNCNYHQFWCTILFEPSAAVALRSFLLAPVAPYQVKYLENEYLEVYKVVFAKFLLVLRKLITFKYSEHEYMPETFGLEKLLEKKLLNLPIVITLVFLYKDNDLEFVNRIVSLYFDNPLQGGFLAKEVETSIDQALLVMNMIRGHLCGFEEGEVTVPIIENRPKLFSLRWVYSVVSYLLNTVSTVNVLFRFHKPAVEIALHREIPFKLPPLYVNIYKELYEMIDGREETAIQNELFEKIIDEINLGRTEFVEMYHTFVSHCLDEALKYMDDKANQEPIVETYLKLMNTALEEDYFICDYNSTNCVATQNEMFESICDIDKTCTEFIVSCINKLPRNAKLQELSKVKRQNLESVFREFRPPVVEKPTVEVFDSQPGPSRVSSEDKEVEEKIRSIMDMFPALGDGFIFQCLESYNFSTSDVINAILEENLPPHLAGIPFDTIRIPPEPEPEKPILAYRGKKPQYDDALKLLNDKSEIRDKLKTMVMEGIQYEYNHLYDDEYDDRFDDDVGIRVPDQPLDEEIQIFNPNRRKGQSQMEQESSEEEEEEQRHQNDRSKMNFCEDPAVIRERREARYRQKTGQGQKAPQQSSSNKDVVGKPKGQGQEKNVLLSRQKKNVNKSGRANHNRKSGASWKRSGGMIPS